MYKNPKDPRFNIKSGRKGPVINQGNKHKINDNLLTELFN